MDIEYFKTVMETMASAGDTAATLAVWWILADKVLPVIGWVTALGILLWRIPKLPLLDTARDDTFFMWARDKLGTGYPGPLIRTERMDTEERLREIVIEYENNKDRASRSE